MQPQLEPQLERLLVQLQLVQPQLPQAQQLEQPQLGPQLEQRLERPQLELEQLALG